MSDVIDIYLTTSGDHPVPEPSTNYTNVDGTMDPAHPDYNNGYNYIDPIKFTGSTYDSLGEPSVRSHYEDLNVNKNTSEEVQRYRMATIVLAVVVAALMAAVVAIVTVFFIPWTVSQQETMMAGGQTTSYSTWIPSTTKQDDTELLSVCDTRADLIFAIDSSGSINQKDSNNFGRLLSFVTAIVSRLNIGQDQVRVGVLLFSDQAEVEIYLDQTRNKSGLIENIKGIAYLQGSTNIVDALEVVRTQVFIADRGDRDGVQNILILLGDGEQPNATEALRQASLIKASGVSIVTVGVGMNHNFTLMSQISSSDSVIRAPSFLELDTIEEEVFNSTCQYRTSEIN